MNISTRWVISFLKQMRQPMGPAAVCLTALCFCGGCAPSGEEEPPRQASYLTDQFGVISPGDTKDYMEIIDLEGNVIYSPAREKTEPAQTPEIEGAAAVPNEAAGPAAVDEAPVEAEPVLATPVHEPEAEVLAPVWEVVAEPSLVEPAAQQEMESEGDVTDSGPRKEVEQQDEEPEQTAPKIGAEPPAQSGVRDASLHSEWPQERDFESTAITLNPSFEDWDGLQATGWETVERDGKMWTPSTGVGHTGDVAMAISGRASEERLFVALRSTSIAVRPGDVVDFELWARSEGASKEGLTAFVQALIGEEWKTLRGRVKAIAAPEWTLQTAYGEVMPPETSHMRLVVYSATNEPADVLWLVDDFRARVKSFKGYMEQTPEPRPLPNVVMFGIDSLRQDVLGCYGANHIHTPNIDRIAREGRIYDQVTAAAPSSKPSFASILTGLYPSQHGAEDTDQPLNDDVITLAQALREKGYFTAGFVFTPTDGSMGANMGFSKGFDVYYMAQDEEKVFDSLIRFLDTNAEALRNTKDKGGLFLFFHSFGPHTPYLNHYPELVQNEGLLGTVMTITCDEYTGPMNQGGLIFDTDYTQHDVDYIKSVYESEVIYTDRLVGDVLARYDWLGLYDSLNIVFTADHGESFRENGRFEHGHGWETCVRVPMILRFPDRIEAGERDSTSLVSIMDVMPTILDLAGATSPPNLTASSLLGNREGTPTAEYGISEDQRHGWLTLRDGQYKLLAENAGKRGAWIFDLPDAPTNYMLFNIVEDPLEQQDLAESHPEELQRLKDALMAHCAKYGIGSAEETHETRSVSEETIEALEALGYTQ